MASWYFDWIRGSDSNDGLSPQTPKKSYDTFNLGSAAAGDSFLFRRGTPQYIDTIYKGIKAGVAGGRKSYYGVYGESDVPHATFYNLTSIGNMIFNAANTSNVIMEDLMFDMSPSADVRQAIYCASQGSSNIENWIIRRCKFKGSAIASGLNITIEGTSSGRARNFLIEECDFYDNGGHGLAIAGENMLIKQCRAWNNGATNQYGGHGFSALAKRTETNSGWTLVSGAVYSRTILANEANVFAVWSNIQGEMTQNTSTPTTPGLREFGVSGLTLYINVGVNPNGSTTTYAWGRTFGIVIANCEAWGNRWNRAAPYHEGHAIALDDWTERSMVIGCKVCDNEGMGISVNRGVGNIVTGNEIRGNWRAGIIINGGNNTVCNNVLVRNAGEDSYSGEIHFSQTGSGGRTRNNLIITNKQHGIWFDPSATGCTSDNDQVYGATTPVSGGTVTNLSTADPTPYLNSDYFLKPVVEVGGVPMRNPLDGAGVWVQGGRTYGGAPLIPGRVPIGAKMPAGRLYQEPIGSGGAAGGALLTQDYLSILAEDGDILVME